jgi:hypothetical protein
MTEPSPDALIRENTYLKQRCAQLEGDVTDLNAQISRLAQQLERVGDRRTPSRPSPLSGGQSS